MNGSCAREYLSRQHWQNAVILSKKAREIEAGEVETIHWLVEHRAYVFSTVFSATAFLESFINEIIMDAVEGEHHYLKSLGDEALQLIGKVNVKKTLDKYYKCIVDEGTRESFKELDIVEEAKLLIKLRNNLVHYRPEWRSGLEALPTKKSITGHEYIGKFPFSSRHNDNTINPIFPDKITSYGCAKWAVDTSTDFVDIFCSTIGIEALYTIQRGRIKVVLGEGTAIAKANSQQ